MNGRYGHDKLNMALLIFWLVLQIIWMFTRFWVIGILDILVIVLIVYRSLSKIFRKECTKTVNSFQLQVASARNLIL